MRNQVHYTHVEAKSLVVGATAKVDHQTSDNEQCDQEDFRGEGGGDCRLWSVGAKSSGGAEEQLTLDDRKDEFRFAKPTYSEDVDHTGGEADHGCVTRLVTMLEIRAGCSVFPTWRDNDKRLGMRGR